MALHYNEAASIVEAVITGKASLRNALYGRTYKTSVQKLNLLASETLKYKDVVTHILEEANILGKSNPQTSQQQKKQKKPSKPLASESQRYLLMVMTYELLLGKKKNIEGGGKLKKLLMQNKSALVLALTKLLVKHKAKSFEDLIPDYLKQTSAVIPRYVRVNLLKTSVDKATSQFIADGWELINQEQAKTILEKNTTDRNVWGKKFWRDEHLPDLLVFPPSTDFHDHPLLLKGEIVLQDKASALAGFVLNPPADAKTYCIDACAAPGQKTAQLAQSMNNMGNLFAFDQDKRRLESLKHRAKHHGITNLTAICTNFLTVDPTIEPYNRVEYILVDPSCSGSGIVSRFDFTRETEDEHGEQDNTERLENLQEFQLQALRHALSFPKVKRVVYSTCSIHEKENEEVVQKILDEHDGKFKLVKILPNFPSRGRPLFPNADYCIRTDPNTDHTIGFFVACFERVNAGPDETQSNITQNNTNTEIAQTASSSTAAKKKKKRKKRKRATCEPDQPDNLQSDTADAGVNDGNNNVTKKAKLTDTNTQTD